MLMICHYQIDPTAFAKSLLSDGVSKKFACCFNGADLPYDTVTIVVMFKSMTKMPLDVFIG